MDSAFPRAGCGSAISIDHVLRATVRAVELLFWPFRILPALEIWDPTFCVLVIPNPLNWLTLCTPSKHQQNTRLLTPSSQI